MTNTTKEKIVAKAYAASDTGRRFNNDDAYLINEESGIFIVADGMGGHEKGEVASWFASKTLESFLVSSQDVGENVTLDPGGLKDDIISDDLVIQYAMMAINKRLNDLNNKQLSKYEHKKDSYDEETAKMIAQRRRMGTTLVTFLIRKNKAFIGHVGDSRAYRIAQGKIQLLTHDHSWVEERVRAGLISLEEAKNHKNRNIITRSLGFKENVNADVDVLTLYPPERFLLCSDGLSNSVEEKDLLDLGQIDDIKSACEQMIEMAKANKGVDNITALLIDISSRPKEDQTKKEEFTL